MDAEKAVKIFSKTLTALVSLRSLVRSGVGIKKLLNAPGDGAKKEVSKKESKKDDKKQKQLHGALLGLQFSRAEADRAVKELSDRIETDDLSDLVRAALGILNKKG